MNYPVWQLGYPGGLLIALIAVLHVFVSHFAVGGGAFLVVSEHLAYKRNDSELLDYAKRHAKFFALVTLVFGAVTGVGIWFTIALVSPEATSSLIHTFVWGWAIEWVFFFVEIAAALIYAYQWDRLDRKTHLIVGWIYFIAAWASMVVINGIITYMLTPGRWLETKAFWDGFFNPTYWPSLLTRMAMAIALAGMFGLITAMRMSQPVRDRVVRMAGVWLVSGLAFIPFLVWWYFVQFPAFAKSYLAGLIPTAQHAVRAGLFCTVFAIVLTILLALWKPRLMNAVGVAVLLVCGLGVMASGEYLREFSRKPYAVNGYIYANDLRPGAVDVISADGVASHAKWLTSAAEDDLSRGKELFTIQCGNCHSVDGYRAIRKRVASWDAQFAAEIMRGIHLTRGTMPRFAGNDEDRRALGVYLASLNQDKRTAPADNESQLGRMQFETRCAMCHTIAGQRRPLLSFHGADVETADGMLQALDAMNPEMPQFTGSEAERRALAKWLVAQK